MNPITLKWPWTVALALLLAAPPASRAWEGQGPDELRADALTIDRPFVAVFRDPADATLGATLEPVSDALRAQLGIPSGQGLVILALASDGPAAEAGLKENDILLEVADQPLATVDDLPKKLKAAGEAPVQLRLMRSGKPVNVQVRPVYRLTIGPVQVTEKKTDYYIGVAVAHPDDTLRAHLDLAAGAGLVATEVVAKSPAEKAGLKVHDILLELDGKPLDSPETLVTRVQAAGNKATALKLLRSGKSLTLTITPELREVANTSPHESLRFWSLQNEAHPHSNLWLSGQLSANPRWNVRMLPSDDPVDKRLDHLDAELKALRKAVDELRDSLKVGKPKGDQ
jgi:serine protease Do